MMEETLVVDQSGQTPVTLDEHAVAAYTGAEATRR
jgi:hypothetical protein